ncbi:hypothetical protein KIN20_004962 [Parelaphostrongylus tenuis]|uniref:Uncharacterized protein n=1 Tax=Parelaphostrongylus tenuis TaxID=148309 RepID=A0AAD5M1D5_PARTN|nr:hypothetical protein KIN20_004962 [Parelaphostrongylus tenuis]
MTNHLGVGLPSSKRKICSGETFCFRPSFNVPALPPNTELAGVMRTAYMLKISVGKTHNHIVATLNTSLTPIFWPQEDGQHGATERRHRTNDRVGILAHLKLLCHTGLSPQNAEVN